MYVRYSKQTLDNPNPIARYAHRRRYELSVGRVLEILGQGQSLLDFGCGQGDFLNQIASVRNDAKLYGFDPESGHDSNRYIVTSSMGEIEASAIDVFSCFETIEHLLAHERADLFADVRRVLKPSGTLIASVPIVGGPTLLLKEANRLLLFRRRSDYSLWELLLASILCVPGKRSADPRVSHKGFDFRETEHELRDNFILKQMFFSPFPMMPWQLNSQVFFVCAKR